MIKYSKFTDNIGSENFTNTFRQSTDKFQKSVCVCVCVGGGGTEGRGEVLHPPSTQIHTPTRFAPPCFLDIGNLYVVILLCITFLGKYFAISSSRNFKITLLGQGV